MRCFLSMRKIFPHFDNPFESYLIPKPSLEKNIAQSTGAVGYTNCISAEELDAPQRVS